MFHSLIFKITGTFLYLKPFFLYYSWFEIGSNKVLLHKQTILQGEISKPEPTCKRVVEFLKREDAKQYKIHTKNQPSGCECSPCSIPFPFFRGLLTST